MRVLGEALVTVFGKTHERSRKLLARFVEVETHEKYNTVLRRVSDLTRAGGRPTREETMLFRLLSGLCRTMTAVTRCRPTIRLRRSACNIYGRFPGRIPRIWCPSSPT